MAKCYNFAAKSYPIRQNWKINTVFTFNKRKR